MRRPAILTVFVLSLSTACDEGPTRTAAFAKTGNAVVEIDAQGTAPGVASTLSVPADHAAGAAVNTPGVVLPAAFEVVMANSNNIIPHSSADMRYQQVFVGAEVGGPQTFRELCLRPESGTFPTELVQQLTIKLGPTDLGPATIGADFDANYASAPDTVFSGNFVMPAIAGGGVDDWVACAAFETPFVHAGGNLIVEIINRSAKLPSFWLADFCSGGAGCNTTRLWSTSSAANVAAVINRNEGLIMRLSAGGIDVEVDIEPGSDRNPVSLRSRGKLPVAVLTTADFDAAEVNPDSVTLGDGTGPGTPVAQRRNGSRFAALEDVDGDADRDLLVHFEVRALVEHGHLVPSITGLVLEGKTRDDRPIRGSDAVEPVGR